MRPLAMLVLTALLLGLWGCGKSEEQAKSSEPTAGVEAKSSETLTADKSSETETPAKSEAQKSPMANIAETTPKTNTSLSAKNSKPIPTPETSPVANPPVEAAPKPTEPAFPKELAAFAFVPGDSSLLVNIRPSAILQSKLVQAIPEIHSLVERMQADGVDPRNVERLTLAVWQGEGRTVPGPTLPGDDPSHRSNDIFRDVPFFQELKLDVLLILSFHAPFDLKSLENIPGGSPMKQRIRNGLTYHVDRDTGYYMPDPTTLLLAPIPDLETALDNKTTSKLVQTALEKGLNSEVTLVGRLDLLREVMMGPALFADEQFPGMADVPDQLETLYAHLNMKDEVSFEMVVNASTESAPKTIKSAFDAGYRSLEPLLSEVKAEMQRELGEELGAEAAELLQQIYQSTKAEAVRKEFQVSVKAPGQLETVLAKIVAQEAERERQQAKKRPLMRLGIAAHMHHEIFKMFPFPNGRSDAPQNEKDKLSWRVHLLPFLDQEELYAKFKLNEPWDSEHNKALLMEMPDIYKLDEATKPGHTQYVAPEGKHFIVDADRVANVESVTDPFSQSIMVLMVKPEQAQPWTKPGGFEIDPEKAKDVLYQDDNRFLALFCDGSVRWLDAQLDADSFKALLTISGADVVDESIFEPNKRR